MDDHPMIEQRLSDLWDAGRPFEACRGQYSGTLIVLASGPSAADFPVERYRHVPMVAMNGSIVRFAETGIRPLFYLCDDRGFVRLRLPLVRQGIELAKRDGRYKGRRADPKLRAQVIALRSQRFGGQDRAAAAINPQAQAKLVFEVCPRAREMDFQLAQLGDIDDFAGFLVGVIASGLFKFLAARIIRQPFDHAV